MMRCKAVSPKQISLFLLGIACFSIWTSGKLAQAQTDSFGDKLPNYAMKRIGTVRFRHGGRILALAYSPDGKYLTGGCGNDFVRVWDAVNGREIMVLKEKWVHDLAYSPNGKYLATGGAFKTLRVWDSRTGSLVGTFKGHKGSIKAVAFHPDSNRLVSASQDTTIRVWSISLGRSIGVILGHQDEVNCLDVSPDGNTIASGSTDQTLCLWNFQNGQQLKTWDAESGIATLAFSPDGKSIVTAGEDGQIRLWNVADGELIHKWQAHDEVILGIKFLEQGKKLASNGYDGKVRVWTTGGDEIITIQRQAGDLDAMAISPNGKVLACGGRNCRIRRWTLMSGKELNPTKQGRGKLAAVSVSPNGKLIASGDSTGLVSILQWPSLKKVNSFNLSEKQNAITTFSPAGNLLVTAGKTTIQFWDVQTWKSKGLISLDKAATISCLAISDDGKKLAVGSNLGLHLFDVHNVKPIRSHTDKGPVSAVAFSPNGNVLALSSMNGIFVFGVETGRLFARFAENTPAASLAFSPSGKSLAAGHFDSYLRLWEYESGKKIIEMEGHKSAIYSLAFNSSGRYLVSGSFDGTVQLWETISGSRIQILSGHKGPVHNVAMAPNNRIAFSGSSDNTLLAWDVTRISPKGELPTLNVKDNLSHLYSELASEKASSGNIALWTMVAGGKEAIEFLQKNVFLVDRVKLNKLIKDLNSSRFAVREKATQKLATFGQWIKGRLEEEKQKPASLEVRLRLNFLLKNLSNPKGITLKRERLRLRRVMEILEQSHRPQAIELLRNLSKGAAENSMAEEAAQALKRIGQG